MWYNISNVSGLWIIYNLSLEGVCLIVSALSPKKWTANKYNIYKHDIYKHNNLELE